MGLSLRRLLRRLKGLRILRRLGRPFDVLCGLVKFFIELLPRFSKLIHTLPKTARQFGKFFRSEQNKNDHKDQYPLGWARRHKSDRIHTFTILS